LSTPEIYRKLDVLRAQDAPVADDPPLSLDVPLAVLQALRAGDAAGLAPVLMNDLEAPALADRPDLARVLADGIRFGALGGLVSGSGPTIALLCEGPEQAQTVQNELQATGHDALHVHGPVPGARVIA